MKRIVVVLGVAAVMAAMGAAYAGVAMAQATTTTETYWFPINEQTGDPCTGEPILITGQTRNVVHETVDNNGTLHIESASVFVKTTAENLDTGERYRVVGNGILAQNTGVDETGEYQSPPFTATNVAFVQYVSTTDRTDNFYIRFQIHITYDANGEPTAFVLTDYAECRG
jgi:hypothetical protein